MVTSFSCFWSITGRIFRGMDGMKIYAARVLSQNMVYLPSHHNPYLTVMTIEDIQAICAKQRGVTEDIKWEVHLCFNVGGKMFLMTSPDQVPCQASIKVADEDFDEITSKQGFMPAPYLARYKWVHIDDITRLSKKQWEAYIETAYRLVASRLPTKVRKQIGLV